MQDGQELTPLPCGIGPFFLDFDGSVLDTYKSTALNLYNQQPRSFFTQNLSSTRHLRNLTMRVPP